VKPLAPGSAAAPKLGKTPRPGWLELVVLSQTIFPAMMFVPALLPLRFVTRVAAFALPVAAWAAYVLWGRRPAGARLYPPAPFLAFAAVWVAGSAILNPGVNTLLSALCALGIMLGVLGPAFWATASIRDPRQLSRLMVLLLACNGASAVMGMAQVYRPDTFRPPRMPLLEANPGQEKALEIELSDGRRILRPPGLTDTPGGAAIGGQASCIFGLALALLPIAWWKRGLCLGLALVGLTIIFYSQVRVLLVTLVLGLMLWAAILALRRDVKKLSTLATCAGLLSVVAIGWVVRSGGAQVMKRFLALVEGNVSTVYYKNRGAFVENALYESLPRYPLGAGPGRTGMAQAMFGNPLAPVARAPLYAETQIEMWVYDGGAPLLLAYALALAAAMVVAANTALRSPDPRVAYWAGVIMVYGVTIVASTFGYPVFMAPAGVQFWALFGALHGADACARRRGVAT